MKYQPCPACPDGNEWGANGPTGRACNVCGGKAYIDNRQAKSADDMPDASEFIGDGK